jgi:hypothetical protein
VSDDSGGIREPLSDTDEYEPYDNVLPPRAPKLWWLRRSFVVPVMVFGIAALLIAIGFSNLGRNERKPSLQEESSTPPKQPDRSSVEPVDPSEPYKSLVLDAARSYLSANANAQTETEIDRLRLCLFVEDGTKERLDCYDSVVAPDPKPKPPVAKLVADCKFLKEEDERLGCFNRFLGQPEPPKARQRAAPKAHPS